MLSFTAEVPTKAIADPSAATDPKPVSDNKPVVDPAVEVVPKADKLLLSKPVNERFPHAVLFGGTCGGTIISPTWILTAGHW